MSFLKNRWFRFLFVTKESWFFLGAVVCLGLISFLGLRIPAEIQNLSEHYHSLDLFKQTLIMLGSLFVAVYVVRIIHELFITAYIKEIVAHLKNYCYSVWLKERIKENSRKSDPYAQGEVATRIMSDTNAVQELIESGVANILVNLIFVTSFMIGFISISKPLGITISFILIAITIVMFFITKAMRITFMEMRKAKGNMSKVVSNLISGVSELFYYNHNHYPVKTSTKAFDHFVRVQLKGNIWDASFYATVESVYPLLLAFVVWVLPEYISGPALVLVLIDLLQRSMEPIKRISGMISSIQRALTGFKRVHEFVDDFSFDRELNVRSGVMDFDSFEIKIDHFGYEGVDSFQLNDLNLQFETGESIGIIGFSGCGKSTLLKILAGIYEAEGKLTLQSKDKSHSYQLNHHDFLQNHHYNSINLVSQDSHIFSDTICFNITMEHEPGERFLSFWKEVTRDVPYLAEWIGSPYEKIRATDLSLGQQQLISAIRSLYFNRKIVLFDEISSGLDSKLELALSTVMRKIQKNSIFVVVAHRIETVTSADRILVMENGKIVDQGPHRVLQEKSSLYCRFLDELRSNS